MNATNPIPHQTTDSPWFWVCVFSAMALAGAIAIGPKYEERQRQIELRYEARQRSQQFEDDVRAADGDKESVRRESKSKDHYEAYDPQRELTIRLTPVLVLLSVVFVGSLGRLCWVQAQSEQKRLFDWRRSVLFVLAAVFVFVMLFAIWVAYSGSPPVTIEDKDQYRAWGAARGIRTVLIFLISGILIGLAVIQLQEKDPSSK